MEMCENSHGELKMPCRAAYWVEVPIGAAEETGSEQGEALEAGTAVVHSNAWQM